MLHELLPLLILAGIFSFYGLLKIAKAYYGAASTLADAQKHLDELITNITPQETPFMRAIKKETQ